MEKNLLNEIIEKTRARSTHLLAVKRQKKPRSAGLRLQGRKEKKKRL